MTKRRLVWVAVAVCVLALAVGLTVWRARPHPVNRANFKKIRDGMTRAEVEAILGPCSRCPEYQPAEWVASVATFWEGPACLVSVDFRVKDDRVAGTMYNAQPSLLDRLRAWLGW